MKTFLKDYFTYTKRERNGILVLLAIIVGLLVYLKASKYLYQQEPQDFSEFEQEIDAFLASVPEKEYGNSNTPQKQKRQVTYFDFDPNHLSVDSLSLLGLSEGQAKVIDKYRAKGGRFRQKADLKKMYVITDEIYANLEPYIKIVKGKSEKGKGNVQKVRFRLQIAYSDEPIPLSPDNFNGLEGVHEVKVNGAFKYTIGNKRSVAELRGLRAVTRAKGYDSTLVIAFQGNNIISMDEAVALAGAQQMDGSGPKEWGREGWQKGSSTAKDVPEYRRYKDLVVNINTADTTELKKLRGIGPSFSKRIVKYRDMLGRFHSLEQLLEVYGMEHERFNSVLPNLELGEVELDRIDLNSATAEDLRSHPYLNWTRANAIVAYRNNHGSYKTTQEVQNTDLVDDSLFAKLAPYLTVE